MDIKPQSLAKSYPAIAIAAQYRQEQLALYIGMVTLQQGNQLQFFILSGHELKTGDGLTLHLDNRCSFAIDERAWFTFENAIDWNYILIDALAYDIPLAHPTYYALKEAFIEKKPWEMAFFSHPEVRLYHLRC